MEESSIARSFLEFHQMMRISERVEQLKFSDICRRAERLQAEFDQAQQDDFIVDIFDAGKNPGVAGYRMDQRMKSLMARWEDANPTIGEMEQKLMDSINTRKRVAGYTALGVCVTLVGVAAVGLAQLCGVDMGAFGEFCASAAKYTSSLALAATPIANKASKMLTRGLEEDRTFLRKMKRVFENEYWRPENYQSNAADWSPK